MHRERAVELVGSHRDLHGRKGHTLMIDGEIADERGGVDQMSEWQIDTRPMKDVAQPLGGEACLPGPADATRQHGLEVEHKAAVSGRQLDAEAVLLPADEREGVEVRHRQLARLAAPPEGAAEVKARIDGGPVHDEIYVLQSPTVAPPLVRDLDCGIHHDEPAHVAGDRLPSLDAPALAHENRSPIA